MKRNCYSLHNVNGSHIAYLTLREIEELCDKGQAVKVWKLQRGKADIVVGARLVVVVKAPIPGAATITKGEVEVNAFAKINLAGGHSRTARLTERQRRGHINPRTHAVEEEDFVERAETKVTLWNACGDDRAAKAVSRTDLQTLQSYIELERRHRKGE